MKFLIFASLASWSALAETNLDILKRLVNDEKHGKVVSVFDKPSKETNISAEYQFPEFKLNPDEVLYFYIPDKLSKRPLSQIGFAHRQIGRAYGRDSDPGLTSALVYTTDLPDDNLRYWGGPASGKLGAKFAEYRNSPEFDALYEWPLKGHKGVVSKQFSKKLIKPNVLRLQNIGTDEVYVSKAYVEVIPQKAEEETLLVFSPKSYFGDSETMDGRVYGGGQKFKGLFPGALRISSRDHSSQPQLPSNLKVDKNRLIIDLPAGKKFSHIDIMAGDTFPDQVKNKDKGWGSLGNARITISIENETTREKRILLEEKNVGPEGVLTASEIGSKTILKPGDRLIITNKWKSSTVYIMALKLGFENVN